MASGSLNLPPGFRFNPTDEELLAHFLYPKASLSPQCHSILIPELDLQSVNHPWDLQGKALSSENKWYFFSQVKENRQTEVGYWKLLDAEESLSITSGGNKRVQGLKKCFVFCIGDQRAEEDYATETNWIMHEYHLISNNQSRSAGSSSCKRKGSKKLDRNKSWILCRVHERKENLRWDSNNNGEGIELSCLDEVFLSFDDDLDEVSLPNY